MARFSQKLEVSGYSKTNNHPVAFAAKVQIRRLVLDAIGASGAHVFDAFAGDGAMFRAVWRDAKTYVGCDLEWYRDERVAFVVDNRRAMRAIDLGAFNVFDLDSYGSPWEQAIILAERRPVKPGERVGLVLTEGSGLKLKMGSYPGALRRLAGLRGDPAGGGRSHAEVTQRAIAGLCRRMGVEPQRRWEAQGRSGADVSYLGLIVQGAAAGRREPVGAVAPVAGLAGFALRV